MLTIPGSRGRAGSGYARPETENTRSEERNGDQTNLATSGWLAAIFYRFLRVPRPSKESSSYSSRGARRNATSLRRAVVKIATTITKLMRESHEFNRQFIVPLKRYSSRLFASVRRSNKSDKEFQWKVTSSEVEKKRSFRRNSGATGAKDASSREGRSNARNKVLRGSPSFREARVRVSNARVVGQSS